ncbi:MAG: SRPBCC family protein [Actinoallomurus sp.]
MAEKFVVTWEGLLPAAPDVVWDAFTRRAAGWLWEIAYEPRVGGAERGLTGGGGTVTAWEPDRRFVTRASDDSGVNQLTYLLEPRDGGTYLHYTHEGTITGDYDLELDACRRHTAFYYHSLGEYVRHFQGRDATYVTATAPQASAADGFAVLRRALGVENVAVGDPVRLAGPVPITGVVDYATDAFLGVRGGDALYRFYGRDRWGWPVGVAVHRFGPGPDGAAWESWLDDVHSTEAVA